jgi:hypothetical protein
MYYHLLPFVQHESGTRKKTYFGHWGI